METQQTIAAPKPKTQEEQAKEAYQNHEIYSFGDRRWVLRKKYPDGVWGGHFWTEIIVLEHGMLYVGGDIDHVIFAYRPEDPGQCLRWIGRCMDIGYYVAQKARIGTGRELIEVYDPGEVLPSCDEGPYELYRQLGDTLPSDYLCDLGPIGLVTSMRVYIAHAAVARLCDLLYPTESHTRGSENV